MVEVGGVIHTAFCCYLFCYMEPLYSGHHWEPTFCSLYKVVPNSGASDIFPVGVVLCKLAVNHNVTVFSELSLVVCWQGRLSRG